MAEESPDGQDKTEDPSEERLHSYREKGEIAVSKELTTCLSLLAVIVLISYFFLTLTQQIIRMTRISFESITDLRISASNIGAIFKFYGWNYLTASIPYIAASAVVSLVVTLGQTQLNFSWQRLSPQWSRLNPISGLQRLVSMNMYFELTKSILKMLIISILTGLLLYSSTNHFPGLMYLPIRDVWGFWSAKSWELFGSVIGMMLLISIMDYFFNFTQLQNKMKMTKQEVREEAKQREIDPHVRGRIRRIQRDVASRKTIEATQQATVLVTNPTHYSIALLYEFGMTAPIVVAKGKDNLALRMREVAKDFDIPIVENKPVARTLYATTEITQEIPSDLYKAVSEIILYVFKLKNKLKK
ncbi:MAG: flagellar type III secretion system protein FlhB [Zetaproteobacteria bacterium]|nr:flagellar type III secretion system protein FlhB [Zetaproteobacteria bacterium]